MSAGSVATFDTPKRKVARAKEHVEELSRQVGAYMAQDNVYHALDPHPENPEHLIQKVKFRQPFPESITDIVTDATHSLRTALDGACYQLALGAGCASPQYCAFPFSGSETNFEANLAGRCKDVPAEIYPIFRHYKPFLGGNDVLYALNKVSNTDKHGLLKVSFLSKLARFQGVGSAFVSMPMEPIWDAENHEIELATVRKGHPIKAQVDMMFDVTFDNVEVIAGEPARAVLQYFIEIVTHILGSLEDEGKRLGYLR